MSDYAIYAIRYGQIANRRASENFIGGDPHDGPMPLDFFVWVVAGNDQTVIVDTGFDATMAKKRNREIVRPVGEGLKAIGVNLATVEDVIVTHMHYDHSGNYDLFPRARYHLQDKEMEYCTGRCMCQKLLRHPFEVDDVTTMVRRVFEGRVQFHDGSSELAPGLSVHWVGGHSRGLQIVRVQTKRGWVVLASDAAHYYANFEQGRPFPVVYNVGDVLAGYETLNKLASSSSHIVPGHDPLVLSRYPAAEGGQKDIVRLDLSPKV
jgi:glyoxylase-like metal-dependent hydrolase (beta-lactamase superfamily II)